MPRSWLRGFVCAISSRALIDWHAKNKGSDAPKTAVPSRVLFQGSNQLGFSEIRP
jgi:hypothetical protein